MAFPLRIVAQSLIQRVDLIAKIDESAMMVSSVCGDLVADLHQQIELFRQIAGVTLSRGSVLISSGAVYAFQAP